MFIEVMEQQGTDRGSRSTPRLINLDHVREMKEYGAERIRESYATQLVFVDGSHTIIDATIDDIKASIRQAEKVSHIPPTVATVVKMPKDTRRSSNGF